MFNKLSSRKTLPKSKQVNVLITSDNLLSRHKQSQNMSPITSSTALTKSCNIKHTIASKNKSIPTTPDTKSQLKINQQLQNSLKLKKQNNLDIKKFQSQDVLEPKTPPKSFRQIFSHRRANSDGTERLDRKLLNRNRSVSSLFNNVPIKSINQEKHQNQLGYEPLFSNIKRILPKKYNILKLSYLNVLYFLYKLNYCSFKSEEEFIQNKRDTQLGVIYRFWINLTNSNSSSLENLVLLLLHVEGLANKYLKIETKIKEFVQNILKNQQPIDVLYTEPQYRFIGIESISSWTNTGRLVIHTQQSYRLQKQFVSLVNYRLSKGQVSDVKEVTPIKKFYTEETIQNRASTTLQQSFKNTRKSNQCTKNSPTPIPSSNSSNYKRKKVSSPYSESLTQLKKVRILKNEEIKQKASTLTSKTQFFSRSLKTEPNTLPFKHPRRSICERLNTQPTTQVSPPPPSPERKSSESRKLCYQHRRIKSDEYSSGRNFIPSLQLPEQIINQQSHQKRIPLIYIDINLDNSHKETIAIYENDKSKTIASNFALKHGLDYEMELKLKDLIDQQMGTILVKIEQQEYQQDTQ